MAMQLIMIASPHHRRKTTLLGPFVVHKSFFPSPWKICVIRFGLSCVRYISRWVIYQCSNVSCILIPLWSEAAEGLKSRVRIRKGIYQAHALFYFKKKNFFAIFLIVLTTTGNEIRAARFLTWIRLNRLFNQNLLGLNYLNFLKSNSRGRILPLRETRVASPGEPRPPPLIVIPFWLPIY